MLEGCRMLEGSTQRTLSTTQIDTETGDERYTEGERYAFREERPNTIFTLCSSVSTFLSSVLRIHHSFTAAEDVIDDCRARQFASRFCNGK